MSKKQKTLLTREGLEELKKEYQELAEIKQPQAVKRMAEARDMGDLTESSEYTAARQDLALIERRMTELEEILRRAEVIKSSQKNKERVGIGSRVTVKKNDQKIIFAIVGDWEADPAKNKVSFSSPLGKALLNKKKGDKVKVQAPAGKITYQILEIN